MEEEEPLWNLSFHFSRERRCWRRVRRTGERGDLSYPSVMHSYISHIYIYTPCCFVLEEEKTILQNTYLWRPDCIFLFSVLCPLWCLPNTVDLKRGEKSDDPSLPSPPFSFKSNQVNEDVSFYMNDWISEGLVYVCFSGLNYFIFFRAWSLSFRRVWSVSMLFFFCPERAFQALRTVEDRRGDDESVASHWIRAGSTLVHHRPFLIQHFVSNQVVLRWERQTLCESLWFDF